MATFLSSPLSPPSSHDFPAPDCSFTSDTTYLCVPRNSLSSRAPKLETYVPKKFLSPRTPVEVFTVAGNDTPGSISHGQFAPKYALIDLLQSIESELASQRNLMLDIQSRLSQLEQKCGFIGNSNTAEQASLNQDKDISRPMRSSQGVHVSQTWWKSCQNLAQNCDTPFNVEEFLGHPIRFSAFDLSYDARNSKSVPTSIHKKATKVPNPTPALIPEQDDVSSLEIPEYHQIAFNHTRSPGRSKAREIVGPESDIVEQVVEVSEVETHVTPMLQSPPQSRRSLSPRVSMEKDVTALPVIPPRQLEARETTHRRTKSFQKLLDCRAIFKKKTSISRRSVIS